MNFDASVDPGNLPPGHGRTARSQSEIDEGESRQGRTLRFSIHNDCEPPNQHVPAESVESVVDRSTRGTESAGKAGDRSATIHSKFFDESLIEIV
jgi:hypothetical protein